MTQLNHTPVAEKVPCHSCLASAEALGILSMSLQTAIQAAQYIRIPLPGEFQLQMLGASLICASKTLHLLTNNSTWCQKRKFQRSFAKFANSLGIT
jgi:hypothetical protein